MSNTNELTTARALVEFGIGEEGRAERFYHNNPVMTTGMSAEEFLCHPQTAMMAMAMTAALVWKGGTFRVEVECGRPGSFHCYVSRWAPDECECEEDGDYVRVCHGQSDVFAKVISNTCCSAMLQKQILKDMGESNDA